MKRSEYYQNLYPLEDLLKIDFDNDFQEINKIVLTCDYTIDADRVARADKLPMVNNYDATVFYIMGYEAAMKRIEQCLIPIEKP